MIIGYSTVKNGLWRVYVEFVEMWNRFVEVKNISGGIFVGHTSEIWSNPHVCYAPF